MFYQNKHSGRKLNWLFHLSKGELKTNYLKASKTGYTFQVGNNGYHNICIFFVYIIKCFHY